MLARVPSRAASCPALGEGKEKGAPQFNARCIHGDIGNCAVACLWSCEGSNRPALGVDAESRGMLDTVPTGMYRVSTVRDRSGHRWLCVACSQHH